MIDKVVELILNHFITNIQSEIKQSWCVPSEGNFHSTSFISLGFSINQIKSGGQGAGNEELSL